MDEVLLAERLIAYDTSRRSGIGQATDFVAATLSRRFVDLALWIDHDSRPGPRADLRIGKVGNQLARGLTLARWGDGRESALHGDPYCPAGLRIDAEFETTAHGGALD